MDVLDGDNCEQIYQLVFVRPRALAHAAGDFLVKFLFNEERLAKRQKEEEAASQKSSSPRKRGRGGKFGHWCSGKEKTFCLYIVPSDIISF